MNQSFEIKNGTASTPTPFSDTVVASPRPGADPKSLPGVRPYQRKPPFTRRGPFQIFWITAASVAVNGPHNVWTPITLFASNLQSLASHRPSLTPSVMSQACCTSAGSADALQLGR